MLNQTIPPDEIVMEEDGPLTDELYAVHDEYPMLHRVKSETNLGLGLALNAGLCECRNELVARMDTDDISNPDRCEKQLAYFEKHPNVTILGSQIDEFVGTVDNIIGRRVVPETDSALKTYMKRRCPFNHMTVMFRKADILKVGNYQDWFLNEDYYLWIRLALANKKFANLSETLVKVRTGVDMYQRRGGKRYFESEREIQKLLLDKDINGHVRYCINVWERFVLQVLMPDWLRGVVFRILARE